MPRLRLLGSEDLGGSLDPENNYGLISRWENAGWDYEIRQNGRRVLEIYSPQGCRWTVSRIAEVLSRQLVVGDAEQSETLAALHFFNLLYARYGPDKLPKLPVGMGYPLQRRPARVVQEKLFEL